MIGDIGKNTICGKWRTNQSKREEKRKEKLME